MSTFLAKRLVVLATLVAVLSVIVACAAPADSCADPIPPNQRSRCAADESASTHDRTSANDCPANNRAHRRRVQR